MKLYELTANYQELLEMIEEGHEGLEDTLEAIESSIEEKAENIAKIIKTVEVQTNAIKEEEKRLAERRTALENQAKNLKAYLFHNLESMGLKKVKGSILTVAIQNNPSSVVVNDESKIPETFFIPQQPKLDRKGLLKAIKDGEQIEGAELYQGQSLRIR